MGKIKDTNKLWERLFPLREGVKVRFKVDTEFVPPKRLKPYIIKKGRTGIVVSYRDGMLICYVKLLKGKELSKCTYLTEVNRVEKLG